MSEPAVKFEDARRLSPYPAYKDSGLDWIGNVPTHWRTCKMGYLARMVSGGTPSRDNPAYWGGSIPWVSPKDMKRREIADSIDHVSELATSTKSSCFSESYGAPLVLIVPRGIDPVAHSFHVKGSQTLPVNNHAHDIKGLTLNAEPPRPSITWLTSLERRGLRFVHSSCRRAQRVERSLRKQYMNQMAFDCSVSAALG